MIFMAHTIHVAIASWIASFMFDTTQTFTGIFVEVALYWLNVSTLPCLKLNQLVDAVWKVNKGHAAPTKNPKCPQL